MTSLLISLRGDKLIEYTTRNPCRLDEIVHTLDQWGPYAPGDRSGMERRLHNGNQFIMSNYGVEASDDEKYEIREKLGTGTFDIDSLGPGSLRLVSVLESIGVRTGMKKYDSGSMAQYRENQGLLREFAMGPGRTFNSVTSNGTWESHDPENFDTILLVDFTIPMEEQGKKNSLALLRQHKAVLDTYIPRHTSKITYSPDSEKRIAERLHEKIAMTPDEHAAGYEPISARRAIVIPDARPGYRMHDVCMVAYEYNRLFGDLEPMRIGANIIEEAHTIEGTEIPQTERTEIPQLLNLGLRPNEA